MRGWHDRAAPASDTVLHSSGAFKVLFLKSARLLRTCLREAAREGIEVLSRHERKRESKVSAREFQAASALNALRNPCLLGLRSLAETIPVPP